MTANEFYDMVSPDDNPNYNISGCEDWYFGKDEMVMFAEEYHQMKIKELSKCTCSNCIGLPDVQS